MVAKLEEKSSASAEMVDHVEGLDQTIIQEAVRETERQKSMSFRQTAQIYRKAIFWSVILSTAIVMEGFDLVLVSLYLPQSRPCSQTRLTNNRYQDRLLLRLSAIHRTLWRTPAGRHISGIDLVAISPNKWCSRWSTPRFGLVWLDR